MTDSRTRAHLFNWKRYIFLSLFYYLINIVIITVLGLRPLSSVSSVSVCNLQVRSSYLTGTGRL